jgi:hypothetical protein
MPRVALRIRSRRAFSSGDRVSAAPPSRVSASSILVTSPVSASRTNRSATKLRASVRVNSTSPSGAITTSPG